MNIEEMEDGEEDKALTQPLCSKICIMQKQNLGSFSDIESKPIRCPQAD